MTNNNKLKEYKDKLEGRIMRLELINLTDPSEILGVFDQIIYEINFSTIHNIEPHYNVDVYFLTDVTNYNQSKKSFWAFSEEGLDALLAGKKYYISSANVFYLI